jgi:uncharacterized protein YsxB (DUF464 family)
MIKIVVFENKEQNITGIKISGHAGYAKKGEDIVCAGVSALGFTLLNSMEQIARVSVNPTVESGYIEYVLPVDISEKQFEISQTIFKTIALGLKNMYDSYREYIEYFEEEV